ncbi:Hypothetical predicted protein [Prunus dulcis]|uniref:Uncharacterized protein n=1 Tax=Prunus dulcis TaxID=3755 RepID=A0A5E4FJ82_PRUDU|nr:Hypothetical predicted protein [Prunus dulcis]
MGMLPCTPTQVVVDVMVVVVDHGDDGDRGGGNGVGRGGSEGGDDGGECSASIVKEVVVVVVVQESAQEVRWRWSNDHGGSNSFDNGGYDDLTMMVAVGVASIGAQHFSAEQCYNVLRDVRGFCFPDSKCHAGELNWSSRMRTCNYGEQRRHLANESHGLGPTPPLLTCSNRM